MGADSNTRSDSALQVAGMSRDERSFLLYAETCCVDGGGLLVGERMNADDHDAAKKFIALGLMAFGRIPSELIGGGPRGVTHYAELTDAGWMLAWELRKARASRRGPYAEQVFAHPLTIERNERTRVSA